MFRLIAVALILVAAVMSATATTTPWPSAVGNISCPGEDGALALAGRPTGSKARILDRKLMAAARSGNATALACLVRHGANVNGTSARFRPLKIVAGVGQVEAVRFLLEHGASPEAADSDGQTPIFFSALHDRLEVTRVLVEVGGADVNRHTNRERDTPLMYATGGGSGAMVEYLLAKGASTDAKNRNGGHCASPSLPTEQIERCANPCGPWGGHECEKQFRRHTVDGCRERKAIRHCHVPQGLAPVGWDHIGFCYRRAGECRCRSSDLYRPSDGDDQSWNCHLDVLNCPEIINIQSI